MLPSNYKEICSKLNDLPYTSSNKSKVESFLEKYGEDLYNVKYRYDETNWSDQLIGWMENYHHNNRKRLKETLKKIIRKQMAEESSTGTGASFSGGTGEQYASPKSFSKGGKNKGTEESEKEGWKTVSSEQRFKAKTFDVEKWHENKS